MLRRVLFRLHWLIGLSASVVLAVVGATGALMAYEDELLRWLNPGVLNLPARTGPPPTLPQVAARARAAVPERPVTFIAAVSEPTKPWRVWYAWPPAKHDGSSRGELRYIDPATGTLLPEARAQRFFATVKLLHRTLLADEVGKQIVGASTIGLVVMTLSGLYLRWPRRVTNWRSWLVIRWSRASRIRWWDVHTVLGTLVLPLYLLAAFSGLYWAYDWYRDGLQRLAGMPVVAKAKPMAGARQPLGDAALERTWNAFLANASTYGTATLRIDDARTGKVDINWLALDAPHDRAFNHLTLDSATGAVIRSESFASKSPAQQLLAGMLPLHNGRYFGPIGVVLVLIGALMLPVFAATGWWLYLDRRRRSQPLRKHASAATRPC
ncbi:PepSY domain-containing protein [Ralstonia sp. SET104]|uniref:PepSY-associated TM helix domain-containing protein n=1 Tax=Ralstonia sp. SET104 TaxID=2448774 RepID=UPI000F56686A|nr:PepSY-associated TM helix domain-containing protein [Ralstonia sp. SET104]GCB04329.1 hypothetical protein PSUB009319_19600 [Ralstonia sp. SET104]